MAVMDYRTQDGLADYGFSIEFRPDVGWRVYIIFEPFQQGHGDSLKSLYQALDGDGRRYVDWSSKLDNMGDAKKVAELWAEVAQGYWRAQEKTLSTSNRSGVTSCVAANKEKYPRPALMRTAPARQVSDTFAWQTEVA